MNKAAKQNAEQERIRKIRSHYDSMILRTKTIRDCEEILRELVRDEEAPSSVYWNVYYDLENRARQIKARQKAIIKETAAAIETEKKMAAHYGRE